MTQTASGVIKKQSCPKSNYELLFSPRGKQIVYVNPRGRVCGRAAQQKPTPTDSQLSTVCLLHSFSFSLGI
jgi:hypothetical protein